MRKNYSRVSEHVCQHLKTRSRQERALAQREEELNRYNEGDYLDKNGKSLVKKKGSSKQSIKTTKQNKKKIAKAEIETLRRKLGIHHGDRDSIAGSSSVHSSTDVD